MTLRKCDNGLSIGRFVSNRNVAEGDRARIAGFARTLVGHVAADVLEADLARRQPEAEGGRLLPSDDRTGFAYMQTMSSS